MCVTPSAAVSQASQAPPRSPPRHGREDQDVRCRGTPRLSLPCPRESAEILGHDKVSAFAELLLGRGPGASLREAQVSSSTSALGSRKDTTKTSRDL